MKKKEEKKKKIKIRKINGENKSMKYLVFSDIHGSLFYANKLKEIVDSENPNKIILLGDLYYHGPRNPLSKEYNPKEVCNILNSLKDKILCCKGNCDAEVDEMISLFKFERKHNEKTRRKQKKHKKRYHSRKPNDIKWSIFTCSSS